jgi:hypothetical protein
VTIDDWLIVDWQLVGCRMKIGDWLIGDWGLGIGLGIGVSSRVGVSAHSIWQFFVKR